MQKKIEKFFAGFGLTVFAIFIFFVVIEGAFRFLYQERIFRNAHEVRDSIHVPRPYVMAVADNKLEGINSLGYKGPLPKMPKPEGEYRVLVFGGSTVFGYYPKDDTNNDLSLVAHMQNQLDRLGEKNIQVYNFGITSTVALQELVRLVVDGVLFEPDLVISYGGGNDLYAFDLRVGYPHRFIFYEINPLLQSDLENYPTFYLSILGSAAIRFLFQSQLEQYFYDLTGQSQFYSPDLRVFDDHVENYVSSMLRMHKVSNQFGAKFISYFQPVKDFYFAEDAIKNQTRNFAIRAEQSMPPEVNFTNLSDLLKDQPESVWLDIIHLKFGANKIVAEFLVNDLLKKYRAQ